MYAARKNVNQHTWTSSNVLRLVAVAAVLASLLLVSFLKYSHIADAAQAETAQQHGAEVHSACVGPAKVPAERQNPWCQSFAQELQQEVAALEAGEGCDIVFYGDSITETWRGTDGGRPCPRCAGVPEVFHTYFNGTTRSTEVLAVGGDQSMHLMWRLQHGQVFQKHQPHMAVVMIGTNDLGAASCLGQGEEPILQAVAGTVERVTSVMEYLHKQNPQTLILILGILPRGSGTDPISRFHLPSDYSRAIEGVNDQLEKLAGNRSQYRFLDCGPAVTPSGKMSPELMPDALHPNADGMRLLAECIVPFVRTHLSNSTISS